MDRTVEMVQIEMVLYHLVPYKITGYLTFFREFVTLLHFTESRSKIFWRRLRNDGWDDLNSKNWRLGTWHTFFMNASFSVMKYRSKISWRRWIRIHTLWLRIRNHWLTNCKTEMLWEPAVFTWWLTASPPLQLSTPGHRCQYPPGQSLSMVRNYSW